MVSSPWPATAALTGFCLRSSTLPRASMVIDAQRHAHRLGHVLEARGRVQVGAAVVMDLVCGR